MSSESDSGDECEFLNSICHSTTSDYLFMCPFSNCPLVTPIQDPNEFVNHLFAVHRIKIQDPSAVFPFLQQYVEYYAERIEPSSSEQTTLENDANVRKLLQQTKLNVILQIQQRERSHDHLQASSCLFCSESCENKYKLFEHMFSVHGFNIGLLDNLVEVDEYLGKLRSMLNNLVCIYCEKTFKSHSVLRKHMRKKKHFKIHPHNHKYDKYYVINFTEPGKSWQMLEDEQPDPVDDEEVSSSGSTDDDFLHYLKSVCLFDDCTFETPQELVQHLAHAHDCHLSDLFKASCVEGNFYACIKIVNYLRRKSFLMRCFVCDANIEEESGYSSHLNVHLQQHSLIDLIAGKQTEWNNDEYLKPFLENDPLLLIIEEILDN